MTVNDWLDRLTPHALAVLAVDTCRPHSMSPAIVLGLLAGLGGQVPHVVVVGCQPLTLDEGIGLSDPVSAAVAPAVETIHRVLADISSNAQKELQS